MKTFPLSLGVLLALSACADWQRSGGAVTSPDGKTIAQVEVALAGASSSNRTRVLIQNGVGGTLPKSVYVVEADGAIVDSPKLRWINSDHLEVAICEASSFRVVAQNFRDPPFVDAGRGDGVGVSNALRVDVANLTYSPTTKVCVPRSAT